MTAKRLNDLDRYWMPFTASEPFTRNPTLLVDARGCEYQAADGRWLIDGTGGLWCCSAGHKRRHITQAIQAQAATLDFAHSFNQSHPIAFEAAVRMVKIAPGFDQILFTNSGLEAVDTALKIALAYHQARGEGGQPEAGAHLAHDLVRLCDIHGGDRIAAVTV